MQNDAFERAYGLELAGDIDGARKAYLAVLAEQPRHFEALSNLGSLLYTTGYRRAGKIAYQEAVKEHPTRSLAHANLASALLDEGDHRGARERFETALRLDPQSTQAHRGFAILLARDGDLEQARIHAFKGARDGAARSLPFRGPAGSDPPRILLITSALGGNVDTERIIDNRTFACDVVIAEFHNPAHELPGYDRTFNAIGDAERCREALIAALLMHSPMGASMINTPEAVLATTRANNASRFATIDGVRTPAAELLTRNDIAEREWAFPMLVRSPGYHTGEHFVRVERRDDLSRAIAALPGDLLLAIEYVDTRGADGLFRKYRMIVVAGVLYPLHLAIAPDWKVHYYTADMNHAERLDEELAFLRDPAGVLGAQAMDALGAIAAMLALDYGGIDFTLDSEGNVVVFEANATMNLLPPGEGAGAERLAALETVRAAVAVMLR